MLGNAALYWRGRQLGIDTVIITGAGYFGATGVNMVATTFEAVLGAIYEESGEAAVLAAVQHVGLHNHSSLMVNTRIPFCTY
jgi:ribonuclease-3